ncbi:Truncated hemoglobin YjbI [Seinonella peptonophila]|uniref:Truncated hemoglobin YjbI n=1 Tax=Seinonella peptonophila TaxID=112248 RepID=A0A1M4Z8E1_9BACL|nr:hypothetical protein [Seinonella peptonophila]SHF14284.1 Truncated hemoglobin YjbI [Seinonella peptonophila]
MEKSSLYEQLVGTELMNKIVEEYYQRIKSDESVNYLFKGDDVGQFRRIVYYSMGAPYKKGKEGIKNSHNHLDVTTEQYQTVANHLFATLELYEIDVEQIKFVKQKIMSVHDQIVS